MYGQISFHLSGHGQLLLIPATAVLIDALGTRVAEVQDDTISWKSVDIDADLGDKLALANGLADGALLVESPSDRLTDGRRVFVQGEEALR